MDVGHASSATSLNRDNSAGSYKSPADTISHISSTNSYANTYPSTTNPQQQTSSGHRRPTEMERLTERLAAVKAPLELHHQEPDDDVEWMEDESEGEDDSRFVNFSLLSHIAMRLKDKVPRGTHVKGSIPYPRAFTGKDIVVSLRPALTFVTS